VASNLSKRLDKLERGIQQLLDTNSGPIYLTEDEAIPEGRDAIRIIMNWVEAEPQLEGEEVHSTKSSRFVSAAKNLSHSCYSGEFREAKSGLTLVGRSWPDIRGSSAGVSSRIARATKDQKARKSRGFAAFPACSRERRNTTTAATSHGAAVTACLPLPTRRLVEETSVDPPPF
jgi:hypothetical protein